MNIRNAFWLILIVIVTALLGAQPGSTQPAGAQAPPQRQELMPIRPQKVVVLSPEVSGLVTEIPHQPQDLVRKGDVLLQLDPNLVEIEIKRFRSQIKLDTGPEEAAIILKFRDESLQITRKLFDRVLQVIDPNNVIRVGSPKELHEAQQLYEVAQLGRTKARAARKEIEYNLLRNISLLQKHTIRAPWDGVVIKLSSVVGVPNITENTKQVEVGEMVQALQPVVALMKVDYMRYVFTRPLEDLSQVRLGQPARLRVVGYDEPVEGRVVFISPEVRTNSFNIEVEFANPSLTPTASDPACRPVSN